MTTGNSTAMKKEMIDKFRALLANDFNKEIITELKNLASEFKAEKEKEVQAELAHFLEDPENDKANFVPTTDAYTAEFDELYAVFISKRNEFAEERAKEERNNLNAKLEIIEKMNAITAQEENIGKAFTLFNELRDKWKEIGRVPGDKHQDIISAYHAAADSFYYNIRIYKDLQELDLKKNLEHKREIIAKMNLLREKENLKEIEEAIKTLQSEWFELGPVPRDEFEGLKTEFTNIADEIYGKLKAHYTVLKNQQLENLSKKQSLVDRAKNIDYKELDNHKSWQKVTEKVLALQEEWKTIGFGPKKENEEAWAEFRRLCDQFFESKKKFYDGLNKDFEINKIRKEELCERAEALQNSTNWKETADKLVVLQKKWKDIGSAGQKHEQKLWLRFRGACNAFFDNKKVHFAGQDEKLAENLNLKLAFLEKIKATNLGSDKEENINIIKTLTKEWSNLGHVPRADMDRVNGEYQKLIDEKFEQSGIDKDELEHNKFINRVQSFFGEENADDLVRKERRFIDEKIRELELQVNQYENNLGFFSKSKGAEKMLKEVMGNIGKVKANIKRLEDQKKIMGRLQKDHLKANTPQEVASDSENAES